MIFAGDNEVTRRPAGADDLSKLILAIVAIGGADPEPGLGPVETATKADIDDAGDSVRAINCRGAVGEDFETVDRERGQHRDVGERRSEEHTSELQSLMRISYAVFCLKQKKQKNKERYGRK